MKLEDVLEAKMSELNIKLAGTSKLFITELLPPVERFRLAVEELAAKEPKGIIVNTNLGGWVACSLYNAGLFGPDIVYIWFGNSFFWPTTKLRLDNCTDQMIAEILKSTVFFSNGNPLNLQSNVSDVLGITPEVFETKLKERIVNPHLTDVWFFWRGMCYSQAVGTLLALDQVDKHLRQNYNDSLINWTSSSENYQTRPGFITELINDHFNKLHYRGIHSFEDHGITNEIGLTGFFQMQLVDPGKENSTDFKVVPVAFLNAFKKPWQLELLQPLKWRTIDNQPPLDSIRVITALVPLVNIGVTSVFLTLSALFLIFMLMYLSLVLKSSVNFYYIDLFPIVGSILIPMAVLLLPLSSVKEMVATQCMGSSLFVIVSLFLIATAFSSKLLQALLTRLFEWSDQPTLFYENFTKVKEPAEELLFQPRAISSINIRPFL